MTEITSDLPRRRKGIVSLENLSPSMLSGAANRYNQAIFRFPNRRARFGALKRPTGADLDAGHDPVIQIGRVGSARAKSKEKVGRATRKLGFGRGFRAMYSQGFDSWRRNPVINLALNLGSNNARILIAIW